MGEVMKVKELIEKLKEFDGELRVFSSADMWDVCYGEVIDVDTSKEIVNNIKEERIELKFTDTYE